MKDKKYYLEDYESGDSYEVSKEQYNRFHEMVNSFLPNTLKPLGQIIIIGTGGDMNGGSFRDLFYKPEGYSLIEPQHPTRIIFSEPVYTFCTKCLEMNIHNTLYEEGGAGGWYCNICKEIVEVRTLPKEEYNKLKNGL